MKGNNSGFFFNCNLTILGIQSLSIFYQYFGQLYLKKFVAEVRAIYEMSPCLYSGIKINYTSPELIISYCCFSKASERRSAQGL